MDRFMKHGEELITDVKKDIVNNCAKESNYKQLFLSLKNLQYTVYTSLQTSIAFQIK